MRSEFEVKLPIGGRQARTVVVHMFGDEAVFERGLEQLVGSGRWQAGVLATPLPGGPDGPITAAHVDALNAVGGAVVRYIVSA